MGIDWEDILGDDVDLQDAYDELVDRALRAENDSRPRPDNEAPTLEPQLKLSHFGYDPESGGCDGNYPFCSGHCDGCIYCGNCDGLYEKCDGNCEDCCYHLGIEEYDDLDTPLPKPDESGKASPNKGE